MAMMEERLHITARLADLALIPTGPTPLRAVIRIPNLIPFLSLVYILGIRGYASHRLGQTKCSSLD